MRFTNADGSVVDSDTQDDATALFLEKMGDLKAHCVNHRIPLFLVALSNGDKASVAHNHAHPKLDEAEAMLVLLALIQDWYGGIFPNHTLSLVTKEQS